MVNDHPPDPQPPPFPRPERHLNRRLLAVAAGALTYVLILYRFQTYQERNHMPESPYFAFMACMLMLGLVLSIGAEKKHLVAGFMVLGALASHAAVIMADLRDDPTNHNLFPFEMALLAAAASPAYLGAALAKLLAGFRS